MPAGFGRAGARFVQSMRALEVEDQKGSDTETGLSILHLI